MIEIYGKRCHYLGDLSLLDRPKISIVGSRRATQYAKETTYRLAAELAKRGWVVVSGGAMGIDAMAHRGAGAANTIVVLPCGIDLRYPKVNASLIDEVAEKGLVISQFEPGFRATPWSFVVRNELVVALGEMLVVAEADVNSGSMRSVEYAKKQKKRIWVLPHRLGQSRGTNELAAKGEAQVIWDMERFLAQFGEAASEDPFVAYLRSAPFYDEAMERYAERILELELLGVVRIENGRIYYEGE